MQLRNEIKSSWAVVVIRFAYSVSSFIIIFIYRYKWATVNESVNSIADAWMMYTVDFQAAEDDNLTKAWRKKWQKSAISTAK